MHGLLERAMGIEPTSEPWEVLNIPSKEPQWGNRIIAEFNSLPRYKTMNFS